MAKERSGLPIAKDVRKGVFLCKTALSIMIEFKTTLDINSQKALNKFIMKKLLLVFIVFSLFLIVFGIVSIVLLSDGEDADISSGITLIVIGALMPFILLLINKIGQKSLSKRTPFLAGETKEIFRFYDDHIEHLQKKGVAYYSQMRADYSYLYKAYSTPTHYFLYISTNQCHVIPKEHITQGTCKELDEILFRRLSASKFKKKSK